MRSSRPQASYSQLSLQASSLIDLRPKIPARYSSIPSIACVYLRVHLGHSITSTFSYLFDLRSSKPPSCMHTRVCVCVSGVYGGKCRFIFSMSALCRVRDPGSTPHILQLHQCLDECLNQQCASDLERGSPGKRRSEGQLRFEVPLRHPLSALTFMNSGCTTSCREFQRHLTLQTLPKIIPQYRSI